MKSKQTGLIGLYSGREIKTSAARQSALTRSQTGKQALSAIVAKYGQIIDNAKYYHVGKGEWKKYSLENDKKRTGKLAPNKETWRQHPHKLDFPGIDTKQGNHSKQTKPHKLSISALKAPSNKPIGRKTPLMDTFNGAKINRLQRAHRTVKAGYYFREGFTWTNNGNTFKIKGVTGTGGNKNIKYVNMKNPSKVYVTNEKDLTFDLHLNKDIKEINKKQAEDNAKWAKIEAEQRKKQEAEHQKQLSGLEGFEQTISVLRRPKVIETLNTQISNNGRIVKRKDLISERVNAGWIVKNETYTTSRKIHGERIGKDHNETVLTNGDITFTLNKTEADFAKYLIKKRGVKPRSFSVTSLKNTGKLAKRSSKAGIKQVGKPALKTIEKPKKKLYHVTKIETFANKSLKGRSVKKAPAQKHVSVTKSIKQKPKLYKGFLVTGNTYPLKDIIKSMGGKWNRDYEGWVVPVQSAKAINKLRKEKKLNIRAIKTEEDVYRRLTEAERLAIRSGKAERKIEIWENASKKRGSEAQSHYNAADDLVKDIPLGQPILVGHYSEKGHRRVLERAQGHMFKGVELQRQSGQYEAKAESLSRHQQYIENPTQLKGRITKLEKEKKYWENKLKNNDKEIAGVTAAHKRFTDGSKESEDRFKEEVQQMRDRVGYYKQQIKNKQDDIESIKKLLPAETMKVSSGVTMTDLTKLKKPLGLASVSKRYHNKNLSGGNFAVELRWNKEMGQGLELNGTHDPDGVVTNLSVGQLFAGRGFTIITKENYKEMTPEKMIGYIKKALDSVQK